MSQVADLRFKNYKLGPKTPLFAQNHSTINSKRSIEWEMVATLHAHLDFPMSKSPREPLSPHYMSKKRPQMAPKSPRICAHWLLSPSNHQVGQLFGYVAHNSILGAPRPPATTHFWWFSPFKNCPNGRLDPHTWAHLATVSCKKKPKEVCAKMGQQGPLGARKQLSSKMILDHLGCQNKCF